MLSALLTACSPRVDTPQIGVYRATLQLPGGEAPFGLEVAQDQDRYVLYLANGSERTRVDHVKIEDGELRAVFPGYENSLRAVMHRKSLDGTVTLIKAGGKEQVIPFKATLGDTWRFYEEPLTDNADVAGHWEMTFTSADGKRSKAVAVFEQQHDHVTGTVMTPTGDHRFLEGQVHGDELQVSTFAGGLAYLYKLRVDKTGNLEGDYWQGLASHERVTAIRNDEATLEGEGNRTAMKDGARRLDFIFRDVDGNETSLDDERFRGKVVLVTLGGTWCPNSHDQAMLLAPFYREYRARGLEIVALMFERHREFEKAARAVRGYRQDLGIDFTTLIAGTSETEEASRALPTLNGVYSFPTTIFIDRKAQVRDIHTGFAGPATGKHYEEYVARFRRCADDLLAERPA